MDPSGFGTFRDLILEKGDFEILVTLLWTPQNDNPNGASVSLALFLDLFMVCLVGMLGNF